MPRPSEHSSSRSHGSSRTQQSSSQKESHRTSNGSKHHDHKSQDKRHKVERRPSALKMDVKLEPLNHSDILEGLTDGYDEAVLSAASSLSTSRSSGQKSGPEYDPNLGVTSRKARTVVYAGHSRAAHYDHVPRLDDLCLNLLADNLDKITCVGDAPFCLMRPVFSKCTPAQLRRIEKHNSSNVNLMEDLDELWKVHVEQEFREEMSQREEDESWRDFFQRATSKREKRLLKITKRIQKKSVKDQEPVKKTLVVESVPQKGRRLPASTKSSVRSATTTAADIKKSAKDSRIGATAKAKHRTGPLMAKTLQMFKQRFRR